MVQYTSNKTASKRSSSTYTRVLSMKKVFERFIVYFVKSKLSISHFSVTYGRSTCLQATSASSTPQAVSQTPPQTPSYRSWMFPSLEVSPPSSRADIVGSNIGASVLPKEAGSGISHVIHYFKHTSL